MPEVENTAAPENQENLQDPTADNAAPPSGDPPADSAADPAAADSKPKTVAEGGTDDDSPADGWGEDWRKHYAKDDEKTLKRLARFSSPKAVIDALFEAQKKISAGEIERPLPENPTEQELADWRKAKGIPEKPDGYFEELPDGLVIGEEDQEVFKSFAEKMHGLNVEPKVMQEVVRWYNEFSEAKIEELAEKDATSKAAAEELLKDEWGPDYKANVNVVLGMLGAAPEGVKEALFTARLPDGTPLGNNPDVLRWLSEQAREINPAATLVPGTATNSTAGIEDEIASIEKTMRENRSAYMRDDRMQARYRQLVDARAKLAERAA